MALTLDQLEDRFLHSLKAFRDAPSFNKDDKRKRLISQIDLLSRNEEGGNSFITGFPSWMNPVSLTGRYGKTPIIWCPAW